MVFGMLLVGASSDIRAQSQPAKVRTIKLEDYGWQRINQDQPDEWVGTRSRSVSIDHQGRTIVGFTTRENQVLTSREHPGLSFHILRFTSEGKVDLSLILPTDNWFNNGFYQGPDDHIYARANGALQFLSQEPDGNANPIWKTLLLCSTNCWITQSPSRRTLVLRELQGPSHYVYMVMNLSSPAPRIEQSCLWIALNAETITDEFAYRSADGIRMDARRWPLCDREHDTELPLDIRGSGVVKPVSDEAFLLLGTGKERRGVELVASNGQV